MNTIEKENHVRSQLNREFQKQMNLKYIYPKYKPQQQTSPIPQEIKIIEKQSPLCSSVQAIPQLITQSLKQQQSGIAQQTISPLKPQQQAQPIQQQQQQQQPKKRIRILEVNDMY
ncbi:unnamed protein product (macronuclear) [Paramecium tetraurelia]|uniref:Uncharacterized protein n=1 Tax=Paramecium tetraurelia TaxID=5888 RepID=A0EFS9_PARTE|nr:uncharacterized protein GSPATT00026493001 [Paramecium tetraurelia]CAK94170.1 unnamed protein product [Paramecium tetraurelia]|eukprot:XP_001461543.1 hypothetical protein (macronuclear) [Paramecium tetraurelia strain d4-2]